MPPDISKNSIYIEKALEHVFLGSLIQYAWQNELPQIEIATSEIDNNGYDVILSTGNISRFVQLKSSSIHSTRINADVNLRLMTKSSGCVVWLWYSPASLEIQSYLFFGNGPGVKLPDISSFKTAQYTRINASGVRPERKNTRLIPKNRFAAISSIAELYKTLFGDKDRAA